MGYRIIIRGYFYRKIYFVMEFMDFNKKSQNLDIPAKILIDNLRNK